MTTGNTQKIRELNDRFRRSLGGAGKRLMTAGIVALPLRDQAAILKRVLEFEDFNEGNDPHGEHDFGAFDYERLRIFWKIDYYDQAVDLESDEPPGPEDLVRVLTVMLAEEY